MAAEARPDLQKLLLRRQVQLGGARASATASVQRSRGRGARGIGTLVKLVAK